MSGISKRVSGSWVSGDYGIMKTATDTITTLPADIYADGNNATVGISGNTVQNGTPTPDNPIMPQETGDETANLFNIANVMQQPNILSVSGTTITKADKTTYNIDLFSKISGASAAMSNKSLVLEAGTYTLSYDVVTGVVNMFLIVVCPYTSATLEPVDKYFDGHNGKSFTLAEKSYVSLRIQQNSAVVVKDIMITSGSQSPTSYIPYGYEIPILSNSTTTPIYLGEAQSTRRVKKQVVTISRIIESGTPNMKIAVVALDTSLVSPRTALSTVVPYGNASTPETFYYINANNIGMVGAVGDTDEQITAKYEGSILYYGIAETTGIVNEPLRKIGDYADTVSGITIPTITGKDTVDVETTLKPSEVVLTYTGWHDATVKEWDGSDW